MHPKYKEAVDCYESAIKINPNYADIYWNLHSLASNIDEAIKLVKKNCNTKFKKRKYYFKRIGNFNN